MKVPTSLAILAFAAGCAQQQSPPAATPPPALGVAEVQTSSETTYQDYPASIEGAANVEIRPQVAGLLDRILVDEGAYVRQGQALFKINDAPYRERLNNALAAQHAAAGAVANARLEVEKLIPMAQNKVISDYQVKAAQTALDRANAGVGYTKAQLYPTLAITAQGGLNAFKASNWFSVSASLFGIVGGGLTQPVLQRRALRTQYELAKIDRERTVILFRQQVLVGVGEVSDALVRITKLQPQQDAAAARVQALQKATKDATLLFRNGMVTYLEVLAVQSNALQSELELVAIKRAQLSANVALYRSAGGGWY